MATTQLHAAAAAGRTQQMAALLQHPAAALAVDEDGSTPLHLAAASGQTEAVRLLLEAAPEAAWAGDVTGMLPIHAACFAQGCVADVACMLLEAAPDTVGAVDDSGRTALHYAAIGGNAAAVKLLLQAAPAAASAVDGMQHTPLHYAAFDGHVEALQQLLAAAPATATARDHHGHTPLHHAAGAAGWEAVQWLVQAAPETAAVQNERLQETPLCLAAIRSGPAEDVSAIVRLLLAAAPGSATVPDWLGWTPLHRAAMRGCTEVVQLLLAAAPEAALMRETTGRLPLHLALNRDDGSIEAARCLLAVGSADLLLPILCKFRGGLPLLADLAARLPLSAEQWQEVPAGCSGLGRVLPAVLARSEQEAGWLVQRLPDDNRQRLRTAALSLQRRQWQLELHLPAALMHRILALLAS